MEWPRVSPLINSNRPRRVSISHHQRNTSHPTRGRVGSREKLFVLRVVSDPLQAHDLVVAPAELDPDSANSAASAPLPSRRVPEDFFRSPKAKLLLELSIFLTVLSLVSVSSFAARPSMSGSLCRYNGLELA